MAKSKSKLSIWKRLKRLILYILIANLGYIIITKWLNPPITTIMIKSWIKGNGLTRNYVSYDEMGRNSKLALICAEDQLFPDHNGFDIDAIKKAIKYNNDPKHKKTIGASTISQQTAKNTFLWNGRDWFRKGLEVYHTFMIEFIWGKKRILEVYLNIAEMGKGIFGIESAAQYYYSKNANKLTKSEAAWIATIMPNPILLDLKKPTPKMAKRHSWILQQMNNLDDDPKTKKLIDE